MKIRNDIPAYYLEGMRIEGKLRRYKWAREEAIKTLRLLTYLLSDIGGKIEEIDLHLNDDLRWGLTFIKLPSFLFDDFVLSDKNMKQLKKQVIEYNQCVAKEDRLRAARSILVELKKWLGDLKDEKTWAWGIASEDIERTAHTPIVIKAKKRGNHDK